MLLSTVLPVFVHSYQMLLLSRLGFCPLAGGMIPRPFHPNQLVAVVACVIFRRHTHAVLARLVVTTARVAVAAIFETPRLVARLAGIAGVAVEARGYAPPAHADLLSAGAMNQFVLAIGGRIASILRARVAVLAFAVFEATVLTGPVSACAAGIAVQRIAALWKARSLKTDFRRSAYWSGRLASCRRFALILGAGIVVIAEGGVAVTTVDGTVFQPAPFVFTFAFVCPDALSMLIAFLQLTAVENGAGDASDALPARVAATGVGAYAGTVITIAEFLAIELIAGVAFPARFALAVIIKAMAVFAFAIFLAVGVVVFVILVQNSVAVVIAILEKFKPIAVCIRILRILDSVTVDVAVLAVFNSVAVNVLVSSVGYTIAINV